MIKFIAETSPGKVLAFRLSSVTKERVSDLIHREKTSGISTEEKAELDHFMWLEHVMRMAKIKARQIILGV